MKKYGIPKKNGSGQGTRANRGRGNCIITRNIGRGRIGSPPGKGRNRKY